MRLELENIVDDLRKDAEKYRGFAKRCRTEDTINQSTSFYSNISRCHGIEIAIERLEKLLKTKNVVDGSKKGD